MNFNARFDSPSDEIKKRDYYKQQQLLRTMNKSATPLSADNMIETLLSKKEIFQRKTSPVDSSSSNAVESVHNPKQVGPWPSWLTPGREPSQYKEIWALVGLPGGLADTARTSTLLMSSRLTTDTLGYIWSLANVTVPGSLTQQELYISLALVALAQKGYTFTNSSVLKQFKEPPLPLLDLQSNPIEQIHPMVTAPGLVGMPGGMAGQSQSAFFSSMAPSAHLPLQNSNFGLELSPSGSGPSPSVPILPKGLPPLSTIMGNVSLLDISPPLGTPTILNPQQAPDKTLAVLSANDLQKGAAASLSIMSTGAQSADLLLAPPLTDEGDDDFDDFKSADIFSSEMNSLTVLNVNEPKMDDAQHEIEPAIDDLFPKCVVKPKTPERVSPSPTLKAAEVRTQESALSTELSFLDIKNDSFGFNIENSRPKIDNGNSSTVILSSLEFLPTSKISSFESFSSEIKPKPNSSEPLSLDLTRVDSHSGPVQPLSLPNMSVSSTCEVATVEPPLLLASQEDKYSALRFLDSSISPDDGGNEKSAPPQTSDDFGDFLAADIPSTSGAHKNISQTTDGDDIQIKCLEVCLHLLRQAVAILDNIEDTKVLKQVVSHERGRSYLKEVLEVERVGRRIRSTRETCDLIVEFENLSKILQPYIEYVKNNHLEEQNGPKCGICLCEYGPAHVKYGINHFHAPCANLYVHMVDPVLPIAPVM